MENGELLTIEQWVSMVEMGVFTPWDGRGELIDEGGNVIQGDVFDLKDVEKKARFVRWYNS